MIRGIGAFAAFIVASVVITVEGSVVISWQENLVEEAKIWKEYAKNQTEDANNREEQRKFHLLSTGLIWSRTWVGLT